MKRDELFRLVEKRITSSKGMKSIIPAIKARAKFEGWLKYEIAALLDNFKRIKKVEVEKRYPGRGKKQFCDLYFTENTGTKTYLELKMVNTSYKVNDKRIKDATKPIRDNVNAVKEAARRLKKIKDGKIKKMLLFIVYPLIDEKEKKHWKLKEAEIYKELKDNCKQKKLIIFKATGVYAKMYLCSIN